MILDIFWSLTAPDSINCNCMEKTTSTFFKICFIVLWKKVTV